MRISWDEAVARGFVSAAERPKADPAASRAKKRDREGEEQTDLIDLFGQVYPQYAHLLIHIPNGGSRKNSFEGYRLKRQGTKKGVSDLFLPVARGGYFGLWIEFKAEPPFNAAVTEDQEKWIAFMLEEGFLAQVSMGAAAAFDVLAKYLALPRTVVMPIAA